MDGVCVSVADQLAQTGQDILASLHGCRNGMLLPAWPQEFLMSLQCTGAALPCPGWPCFTGNFLASLVCRQGHEVLGSTPAALRPKWASMQRERGKQAGERTRAPRRPACLVNSTTQAGDRATYSVRHECRLASVAPQSGPPSMASIPSRRLALLGAGASCLLQAD